VYGPFGDLKTAEIIVTESVPGDVYFVAPGALPNKNFGPVPITFWERHPFKGAIWNILQLAVDHHFNPILHPLKANREADDDSIYDSILRQSFTEVNDLDSMRRNFDKLPEELQDFVSHMQRRDYPTLIQPPGVCGAGAKDEKKAPLLLLAIKTIESNFKDRQAIRHTWGQVGWVSGLRQRGSRDGGGYIRRVFLLGRENSEEVVVNFSDMLQMESAHYGDILQWDFRDTFFNLTLKDVLFWRWFSKFCSQTLFVFMGDDDVFVNTLRIITYLEDQLQKPQAHRIIKNFMVGNVSGTGIPSQVSKSKYFIPDSFYKGLYPMYASGRGVVYSGLLTKRLHSVSKRVHLFPIDDVYVGMCMMRLNAYPIHHPAFLTFDFSKKETEEQCSYRKNLLVYKCNSNQLVELWAEVNVT
uniref:Hexosyltransferase n=1 Tax=Mastacembelus armatus TaxID=205130 RepID=A0A3Q3MPD3_9TELE